MVIRMGIEKRRTEAIDRLRELSGMKELVGNGELSFFSGPAVSPEEAVELNIENGLKFGVLANELKQAGYGVELFVSNQKLCGALAPLRTLGVPMVGC